VNYPYLAQGETLSSSSELDIAPRSIDFDNVNVDDVLEAENIEDSEISGTTNVAPGTDATIRVSSTEASSSFRNGQDVNITEDGSVSAEFDFSDQEVEDQFQTAYRVSGSSVDSIDSMLVEEGTLEDEAPEEDDESEDDGESDDGMTDDGESDDSASDDSESDDSESDDGESDDSSSEETPGFGAIVALVAVLGAALLATRRQN
jgi:PGF-CTERM protein